MFEKNMKFPVLLDFYGALLTERKSELLDLYYNEDLSLAEISEITGISRQGVRDSVKKAEADLQRYEDILGFVKRASLTDRAIDEAKKLLDRIGKESVTRDREISLEVVRLLDQTFSER